MSTKVSLLGGFALNIRFWTLVSPKRDGPHYSLTLLTLQNFRIVEFPLVKSLELRDPMDAYIMLSLNCRVRHTCLQTETQVDTDLVRLNLTAVSLTQTRRSGNVLKCYHICYTVGFNFETVDTMQTASVV
jgi:hypothetical protein